MSWQLQVLSSARWFKEFIHLIEYSFNETDMIDYDLMLLNDINKEMKMNAMKLSSVRISLIWRAIQITEW